MQADHAVRAPHIPTTAHSACGSSSIPTMHHAAAVSANTAAFGSAVPDAYYAFIGSPSTAVVPAAGFAAIAVPTVARRAHWRATTSHSVATSAVHATAAVSATTDVCGRGMQ